MSLTMHEIAATEGRRNSSTHALRLEVIKLKQDVNALKGRCEAHRQNILQLEQVLKNAGLRIPNSGGLLRVQKFGGEQGKR